MKGGVTLFILNVFCLHRAQRSSSGEDAVRFQDRSFDEGAAARRERDEARGEGTKAVARGIVGGGAGVGEANVKGRSLGLIAGETKNASYVADDRQQTFMTHEFATGI